MMQDDNDDDDDPMILNNRAKNHTSERTIVPWTVIFFLAVQKFFAQTKRFHFTVEHTNADQPNQADKHYPHNNPIHTSP